jgi:FKBP-type peptidyl-prolyl cis-trans isomerase FkpA
MKFIVLPLIALSLLLPAGVRAADKPAKAPELTTFEQKFSYVIGREIGQSFQEAPAKIDVDIFVRGLQDAMNKRPSPIAAEEETKIKEEFSQRMQAEQGKRAAEAGEKNLKEEEAFLAKNKTEPGVKTTESGLQYKVLQDGVGAAIKASDRVKVHYRGTLVNGTEFDSSYSRNQPAIFELTGVIPGWTEGLQLMRVGGKYRLWVPSKLAYGARGAGRAIGPNALLVFDIEPLEVMAQ